MNLPTVAIVVDWRRCLKDHESYEALVAEAMDEALRRATLVTAAAGRELGLLRGWEMSDASITERRPYPLTDVPMRLDGFSGGMVPEDAPPWSGLAREGRVVVRGVWEMTGPSDPA